MQHYHVCVVLRFLTKGIHHLAIEDYINEDTEELFTEIGELLNRILVINQTMSSLISMKTVEFVGIDGHIRDRYDIDEIWKDTNELIENERKFDSNKLTSIYLRLYDIFNELSGINPNPIVDIMIDYCLNGLYLGYMMEVELDRLWEDEEPKLPEDKREYFEGERRITFFKSIADRCEERMKKSREVLCI